MESFYYLARLLARNPGFYYTHSAHNFARGKDLKQGWVGGVEISTGSHEDVEALVDDFAVRRAELASVCTGLLVPMGHLINYDTPTNTCAIHVHIGGVENKRRLYGNLIHFLPVLALFTMNSPFVDSEYFGQSYRMHSGWAIGCVKDDWTGRFQDIILSKRLGTIEMRLFDPCWDLERVRALMRVIGAIADLDEDLAPNIERYNTLRSEICRRGLLDETIDIARELRSLVDFPMHLVEHSASNELAEVYNSGGLLDAYSALDNGYRNGVFEPRPVDKRQKVDVAKGVFGFAAYFIPRLPYYAWKGIRES